MDSILGQGTVALVTALFGLVVTIFKTIKFVREGEKGCRLRFGKVVRDEQGKPIIHEPGFLLLIPWVEILQRRHVRQQTQHFTKQEIFISGDLVFIVSAIVRFRVEDVYKALFEVDNLDDCINDRCMAVLRDVLQSKSHEEIRDTEKVSHELLTKMKDMESEWGVVFLDARLTSCAPSENSAQILSSKTSAEIRAHAAKAAAESLGASPEAIQGLLSAIVGTPVITSASIHRSGEVSTNSNARKPKPTAFARAIDEVLGPTPPPEEE